MKKIFSIIEIALYASSAIGCLWYAMHVKSYLIAASVIVLAVLASPTFKKAATTLIDEYKENE